MGRENRRAGEERVSGVRRSFERDEFLLDEVFKIVAPRRYLDYEKKRAARLEDNLGAEVVYWSGEAGADGTLSGRVEDHFDLAGMLRDQGRYVEKPEA